MRSRPSRAELVLVVVLVVAGTWLRWHHLGTPSLWWDEIVELRMATRDSVASVWRIARDGLGLGSGNAGAVPLDYLVLHAWLRATPTPAPGGIERHVRIPAFAFAAAALPLAWLLGRRAGGPVVGILALGLLAPSLPHVLYAAEVRFYALSVLATLASLLAFAALVRAPSPGRLVAFTATNVAFVLAALYGTFLVAAELVVLLVLAWRSRPDTGRRSLLAAACLGGLAVAVALAAWLAPGAVLARYGRGATAMAPLSDVIVNTFVFLAGGSTWLAVLYGAMLLAAPIAARTDRVSRSLAAVALLAVFALPVIQAIAGWKQYYYHPRHALFLLPTTTLATALVVGRALAGLVPSPTVAVTAAAVLGTGLAAGTALDFVRDPIPYFHRTKTHRDYRGLARLLAVRTAGQAPDEAYVVLLEGRRPGHLANPTLAYYLDVYGIADRVMLFGVDDPLPSLRDLRTRCPAGCRGPIDMPALDALGAEDPFDQPPIMRRLMDLRPSRSAPRISGVGLVTWAPTLPPPPPGIVATRLDGLAFYELRTDPRASRPELPATPAQVRAARTPTQDCVSGRGRTRECGAWWYARPGCRGRQSRRGTANPRAPRNGDQYLSSTRAPSAEATPDLPAAAGRRRACPVCRAHDSSLPALTGLPGVRVRGRGRWLLGFVGDRLLRSPLDGSSQTRGADEAGRSRPATGCRAPGFLPRERQLMSDRPDLPAAETIYQPKGGCC